MQATSRVCIGGRVPAALSPYCKRVRPRCSAASAALPSLVTCKGDRDEIVISRGLRSTSPSLALMRPNVRPMKGLGASACRPLRGEEPLPCNRQLPREMTISSRSPLNVTRNLDEIGHEVMWDSVARTVTASSRGR